MAVIHGINAIAAIKGIGTGTAHQGIVARPGIDHVVARTIMGNVIAIAAQNGVVACIGPQNIVAAAAINRNIAIAIVRTGQIDHIVARTGIDHFNARNTSLCRAPGVIGIKDNGIIARRAGQGVATITTGKHIARQFLAIQRHANAGTRHIGASGVVGIIKGRAGVIPGKLQHIIARAANQRIGARAACKGVVTGPPIKHIVATIAQQGVIPGPGRNAVIAAKGVDHVIAIGPAQGIVKRTGDIFDAVKLIRPQLRCRNALERNCAALRQ